MPYYRITIVLKTGKVYKGIRQIDNWNIDAVDKMVKSKAKSHFSERNIKHVDVVMIPKNTVTKNRG